jgi:hypothetical protein
MQDRFSQWRKAAGQQIRLVGVTAIRCIGRSVLPALLLWFLFSSPAKAGPPSTDTLQLFWAVLTVYSIAAIVLVVQYFPHVARAGPHRKFFYFFDLACHAAFLITIYGLIYKQTGLLFGTTPVTDPMDVLYFSIVTWTTLGYGDIVPAIPSRMFAASEAICGYVFMGLYLAIVLHVLTAYATLKATKNERTPADTE